MITCENIISYLDTNYNHKKTLSELSNNPKITSTISAYDFDKIKRIIYRDRCTSADALLIKKNLNLIEFKTGFDSPDESLSDKVKKENLMLKIRLKAYESLHLLQTAIIDEISPDDKLCEKIKTIFCAVIDTNEPVVGDEVIVDILSDAGSLNGTKSFKTKITEDTLKMYRKETNKHKKLFYDDVFVLYDYEFDNNVSRFK